jgi:hypothetical protein
MLRPDPNHQSHPDARDWMYNLARMAAPQMIRVMMVLSSKVIEAEDVVGYRLV